MAAAAQVERWVVGILGFISGLVIASVPGTFPQIKAAGTVGERTVFPYATTWMNAAALVVYAWPKSDWPVVGVNIFAFGAESVYCLMYIRYSVGWRRIIAYVMAAIQLGFAVVLVVLQLTFFAHGQHHKDREVAFGWVGAITAILMYISPSWDMYVAVRNHNVEGLSLGLSMAFLANAIIWTGYSFIDPFNLYYLIANSTGIVSAILQGGVWMYCRYHGQ